jgi:hypothetical protein
MGLMGDGLRYRCSRVSRRLIFALLTAILLAQPAAAVAAQSSAGAAGTATESSSPINDQGSSYNYRSNITAITPDVPGLRLEVLEFADRLALTNHTGKTVTVYGYQEEPYARAGKGAVAGQLFWTPESSKAPTAVIVLGVLIAVLGVLFVLFVRRRRSRAAADAGGGTTGGSGRSGGSGGPPAEAW